MMSTKAKGRRFEWRVRDHFRERGYAVFRCSASKPIDLVALKAGETPLLIECKVGRSSLGKVGLERLLAMAEQAGARAVLAVRKGRRLVIHKL